MNARRFLSLFGVLVGLTLGACGGSGSSGFDDFSENAAIDRALSTQQCVEQPALTICPADTPRPAPMSVDTGLSLVDTIPCAQAQPAANGCAFVLPFVPQGFPATTTYRVATRLDPNSEWMIESELVGGPTQGTPDFTAPVEVDASPDPQELAPSVQLAVLAFAELPVSLPAHVEQLAESGADFAFVTPVLHLHLQPPQQPATGSRQR